MDRSQLILYIFVFILINRTNSTLTCLGEHKCKCSLVSNMAYTCKEMVINILSLYTIDDPYIEVRCLNNTINYIEDIPRLEKSLENFVRIEFIDCEFNGKISAVDVINFMKVNRVEELVISTEEENKKFNWKSNYFEKLDNIHLLTFLNIDVDDKVPTKLLSGLSNLKNLQIRSSFPLKCDFFAPVPKLTTLHWIINKNIHVSKSTFEKLGNLTFLSIDYKNEITIDHDVFSPLKSLEKFMMNPIDNGQSCINVKLKYVNTIAKLCNSSEKFHLTKMYEYLFKNLNNLTLLDLGGNGINVLSNDVFCSLQKVETISLSHNSLTNLPELLFKNTKDISTIYLSQNKLTQLPDKLFSNLTKLIFLYIDNNCLKHISKDLFNGLYNLEELYVDNNQLDTIDSKAFLSLKNLKRLDLNHNFLDMKSITFLPNLIDINLSHNNMTSTDIFNSLRNSEEFSYINLANNKIVNISIEMFTFKLDKVTINLKNNSIEEIKVAPDTFNRVKTVNVINRKLKIYLSDNPINCGCKMYNFLRIINIYNGLFINCPQIFDFGSTNCSSSSQFPGRRISDIKPRDISCHFNKSSVNNVTCPQGCNCFFQPDTGVLGVNCTSAGLTKLPIRLPKFNNSHSTHLYLSNNKITDMYKPSRDYEDVVSLYLNNNSLMSLSWLPPMLKVLKLENNNITTMNTTTTKYLIESKYLTNLSLQENPWKCTCKNKNLFLLLKELSSKIDNIKSVQCQGNLAIYNLEENYLCSSDQIPQKQLITIIVCLCILILLIIVSVILCIRFSLKIKIWLVRHNLCLRCFSSEDLNTTKQYDSFVNYNKDGVRDTKTMDNSEHMSFSCVSVMEADWGDVEKRSKTLAPLNKLAEL